LSESNLRRAEYKAKDQIKAPHLCFPLIGQADQSSAKNLH
jgi:hypothetical protein